MSAVFATAARGEASGPCLCRTPNIALKTSVESRRHDSACARGARAGSKLERTFVNTNRNSSAANKLSTEYNHVVFGCQLLVPPASHAHPFAWMVFFFSGLRFV